MDLVGERNERITCSHIYKFSGKSVDDPCFTRVTVGGAINYSANLDLDVLAKKLIVVVCYSEIQQVP